MNWTEFRKDYLIEVDALSTVDVAFDENTPMFALKKPDIQKVVKARVLNKKTFQLVKEYDLTLDYSEIRSLHCELRQQIIRDFNIEEYKKPRLSIYKEDQSNLRIRDPRMIG